MTRTNFTGLEMGSLAAEGVAVGSVAIESSIVRSGQYSLKATPASGATGYWYFGGNQVLSSDDALKFSVRVTALPATARRLLGTSSAAVSSYALLLNPSGTLTVEDGTGTDLLTSAIALTDTARWYRINFARNSVDGLIHLYIDGTDQGSWANANAAGGRFGADDTVAATYTAYFDDISIDNADNVVEDSIVVALLPTSLNAAGGWVEGDGAGTAGMAAAVATRPPPGVASASETSATNIESPTNSATDNCDMNMTTYSAAGIGGLDRVNAVRGFVRHGEDIATATKAGALQIVSNPVQSGENSFNYGDDLGAHAGEVGGAWATARGSLQTEPAVVYGTAPVLRVGKRTATTRVVCVDFMAIMVDYTPGPLPSRPKVHHYPQLLAH